MNSLALSGRIMVNFFTKSALKHPLLIQKASYIQDQRGCMAIIKGHLVPLSQIRGYADDKTTPSKEQGPEGKQPGLADEDDEPDLKKAKKDELKEKAKAKDDK